MIKRLKNVGGNLTYFCLGPKTEINCWDLRFSVRSKILAFCGTLLREILILVPNQNCAKRNYASFLPGLEITSLKGIFSNWTHWIWGDQCVLHFSIMSILGIWRNFQASLGHVATLPHSSCSSRFRCRRRRIRRRFMWQSNPKTRLFMMLEIYHLWNY